MERFMKTQVVLPIIIGIIVCGILFAFGEIDDAPGLCAIGLSIGFILFMVGINNTGIIKKGLFFPLLLLFLSAFVTMLTTSTLVEGEFTKEPIYSVVGYSLAMVMLLGGIFLLILNTRTDDE